MVHGHEDYRVAIVSPSETNIFVDLLLQGSYKERRSVLENHGDTASMAGTSGVARMGKFFTRAARGYITTISVYCENVGASDETITVYMAPYPTMGPLHSVSVPVPAGATPDWLGAYVNEEWGYDSMFLWLEPSSSAVHFGTDTGTPPDGYLSGDSGATWLIQSLRPWIGVYLTGQTVGDIPVSGIVNVIRIPNISQETIYDYNMALPLDWTTLTTFSGAGEVVYLEFWVYAKTSSHLTGWRVYADDNKVLEFGFNTWSARGHTASTPAIALCQYAVDGICDVLVCLPIAFRRKLEITAAADTTAGQSVAVWGLVNAVK